MLTMVSPDICFYQVAAGMLGAMRAVEQVSRVVCVRDIIGLLAKSSPVLRTCAKRRVVVQTQFLDVTTDRPRDVKKQPFQTADQRPIAL